MARPLSEKKRDAILSAAAELVGATGTGATTARIAQGAGVSEGTLFTYFTGKDDLLNQLFLEIEADLAQAMLDAYPASADPRTRTKHLWDGFINWGAAQPARRKALRQLKVSDRITPETRRRGDQPFLEIRRLLEENLDGHAGHSPAFIGATMESLADMTLEFIARDPARIDDHRRTGFEVFWKGIGR